MKTTIAFLLFIPTFTYPLFDSYKAQRAYEEKDYAKAASLLAEQLKQKNNALTNYNLGVSAYRAGKENKEALKAAVEQFDQAAQDPKLRRSSLFNKANALAYQGEYEQAVKILEELLKEKPTKPVQHNLDIMKKLLEQKKKQEEQKKKEQEKKEKEEEKKDDQDQKDQHKKEEPDKDPQKKKQKQDQDGQQKKSGDDKKEQERKKKEQEEKDKEEEPEKPGDEQSQKPEPQEPQRQAPGEEKLNPALKSLLAAAQADDSKEAKKLLKAQLQQHQSPPGQKNW